MQRHIHLEIFLPDTSSRLELPYADEGIQAGFPSPAQDYINEYIDLNRDSMIEEGIEPGDILVIDRSIEPDDGDLAVCCLEGEFTLKRIRLAPGAVWLVPSNESFDPILVTPGQEFQIWGVVTYTIKHNRRPRRKRRDGTPR